MIFCSRNEDNVLAADMVNAGEKTISRRKNPEIPGTSRACCPGRGKFAVCRIIILSCEDDAEWQARQRAKSLAEGVPDDGWQAEEARKEGFKTWDGLWSCIFKLHHGEAPSQLYRIEFVKEAVQ